MDVYCKRCGEPWDLYGVNNGDMTPIKRTRYLDLDAGTLTPTMATPEVVSRLTGIKPSKLIGKDRR